MATWKARLFLDAKGTIRRQDVDDEALLVPLDIESIISVFVYEYLGRPQQIQVTLIETGGAVVDKQNPFELTRLDKKIPTTIFTEHQIAPAESQLSKLPAIAIVDDAGATTVISGLCSVCRMIAQLSGRDDMLGFKRAHLAAPAEASVWTQFCEIDVLRFLENFLADDGDEMKQLDEELARFEMHLKQPVRINNFAKIIRDMKRTPDDGGLEMDENEKLRIKHKFVEGPTMILGDLILFCVFYFVFRRVGKSDLSDAMPLTVQWFMAMERAVGAEILDRISRKMVRAILLLQLTTMITITGCFQSFSPLTLLPDIELPSTEFVSLYKSDPKRYKPRKRIFTIQADIDKALEKINRLPVNMINGNPTTPGKRLFVDWSAAFGMPEAGDVPKSRLERKQAQLKSVAQEVIHLARPGNVIVDFCSGSGHLGLLIASLLPNCQIVLLENKAESLDRAKIRGKSLGLSNVLFLQTNLDYFSGNFDIGISLHACGVATDIVMSLSVQKRAHFVCCPCCYGGILNMPHITFPRSEYFRQPLGEDIHLTTRDYLCIAHGSDQSHAEAIPHTIKAKCEQGQLCMDIIDYDRRRYAEEQGYRVLATKLEPVTCTQKNRLLIGECVTGSRATIGK